MPIGVLHLLRAAGLEDHGILALTDRERLGKLLKPGLPAFVGRSRKRVVRNHSGEKLRQRQVADRRVNAVLSLIVLCRATDQSDSDGHLRDRKTRHLAQTLKLAALALQLGPMLRNQYEYDAPMGCANQIHESTKVAKQHLRADPVTFLRTARRAAALHPVAVKMCIRDRGNAQAARNDLEAAHESAPADPWIALRLARRYAADGDAGAGRRLLAAQSSANPHDPDQRFAEALFLETVDDRPDARAALNAVPAGEQSDGMRALLARLEAADQPSPKSTAATAKNSFVTEGISFTSRPGDGGTSELHAWKLPSEWRFALTGADYFFVRADAVHFDSGTLPVGSTIPLLGTIQEAGPAGTVAASLARTSATGVAPGIGYASSLFSGDIGTTPLGFTATNLVGGLKFTPTVGPVDFSVGVARRPVTSSLLSYAGMRDPVSGHDWGGRCV